MKTNYIIAGVVIVLGVIGGFWYMNAHKAQAPTTVTACTLEAKLCPDGVTTVGRTGPNCEFAPCPAVEGASAVATTTLSVGETGVVGNTTITVLGLDQDSRCPVDVQCIQAGTVKVDIAVGTPAINATLTLGQAQEVGNQIVTLTAVTPSKNSKQTLVPSDYLFTFSIESNSKG